MSTPAPEPTLPETPRPAVPRREWLIGPAIDLIFIANVAWPLLLLAQWGAGFDGAEGVRFWQVYFVTTPHRWVTLAIVFLDRDRFQARRGSFLGVALLVIAVCASVRLTTGTLTCLLTIDYVWNAWHFAAQHHGIYRIYGRMAEPDRSAGLALEKWGMRLFLLYVTLRVAGATWANETLEGRLRWCDWAVLAVPLALLLQDLVRRTRSRGRTIYLCSVSSLYLGLLWAAHTGRPALVLSLATASALFHALEYLTLVGWMVGKRRSSTPVDRLGILGFLAPRWGLAVGLFVLVLGAGGWLLDKRLMEAWLMMNVVAAFLHYAYDGMIWRGAAASGRSPVPAAYGS